MKHDSTAEEDWFSLDNSIKDCRTILIVGPDALEVNYVDVQNSESRTALFYTIVAEQLLKAFGLEENLKLSTTTWALHGAVSTILSNTPAKEQKIRREVTRLISEISQRSNPSPALCKLGEIQQFSLFVSLTPDNILEKALHKPETKSLQIASYSPKDSTEVTYDLQRLNPNERGLFQIFGSSMNAGSNFAMHEEDTLEYLFKLQTDVARRSLYVLSELRRRDLLFIGCNFPDWLGRAMFRLVNEDRLFAKETQEYLCSGDNDPDFSAFLSHFSPNTLMFFGDPLVFMDELANRFANQPVKASTVSLSNPGGPTIFVSYASQDANAAKQLADTLLGLGFSNVWLDKKQLKGGDDWSHKIDEAIDTCDYFMPILSMQANSRDEGVFWEEWDQALKRKPRMKRRYLLPVIIDYQQHPKASYTRINEGETRYFFELHLIHAPSGLLNPEDRSYLADLCQNFRTANNG